MAANNDKIQFRGKREKEASKVIDQMRLGGINISELARQGLQEKLRETLSDEEKIEIHQRYEQGEISDEIAQVLIGDSLEEMRREKDAFESAMEIDTNGVYQD